MALLALTACAAAVLILLIAGMNGRSTAKASANAEGHAAATSTLSRPDRIRDPQPSHEPGHARAPSAASEGTGEPAIASMAALRRPQTDEDRDLDRAATDEIAVLTDSTGAPSPEDAPGTPIDGSFRLLAGDLGAEGGSLYAFRTDRGRVCGGLLATAVGCFESFHGGDGVVNWTVATSDAGGTIIFGFAPDRVRAVGVLYGDSSARASTRDNAFYLEIAGVRPDAVTTLIVVFENGREEQFPLKLGEAHTEENP
jgi:hypothetical protein